MPEEINEDQQLTNDIPPTPDLHKVIFVQSMFENYFLDYASYVILDRAVPDIRWAETGATPYPSLYV